MNFNIFLILGGAQLNSCLKYINSFAMNVKYIPLLDF